MPAGHSFRSFILRYLCPIKNLLFWKFLMTSFQMICGLGPLSIKNYGYANGKTRVAVVKFYHGPMSELPEENSLKYYTCEWGVRKCLAQPRILFNLTATLFSCNLPGSPNDANLIRKKNKKWLTRKALYYSRAGQNKRSSSSQTTISQCLTLTYGFSLFDSIWIRMFE